MNGIIEEYSREWRGAIVTLRRKDRKGDLPIVRPAAFLFDRAGGLAWIEPSYADPFGLASPAWHEVAAPIIVTHDSIIEFDGPVYFGDIEPNFGQDLKLGGSLAWFADFLKKSGSSWDQERARIIASGMIPPED